MQKKPTKKKKLAPIRPLSRQKLLSSNSSGCLGLSTPPPVPRGKVSRAYATTPDLTSQRRPETAPEGSRSEGRLSRPQSRATGPGGQGTFLTGCGLEDDGISAMTERDPDEKSVEAFSAMGLQLSTDQASK